MEEVNDPSARPSGKTKTPQTPAPAPGTAGSVELEARYDSAAPTCQLAAPSNGPRRRNPPRRRVPDEVAERPIRGRAMSRVRMTFLRRA